MNDLLAAAKAVIERWENHLMVLDGTLIKNLRAAVERAETVPTEFEEYWITQGFVAEERQTVLTIWSDAQQAERERLKDSIKSICAQDYEGGEWHSCGEALLEMIDGC